MYLRITSDMDIGDVERQLVSQGNDSDMLQISFATECQIDDKRMEVFANYMQKKFPDIRITISFIHPSDITTIKSLLANPYLINHFDKDTFLKLVTYSDAVTQFVLGNGKICEKLNSIDDGCDNQTFENSCAARAIMVYLRQINKIKPEEYTRSMELEIYSRIWRDAGEEADLGKMIGYLCDKHFFVNAIEIAETVKLHLQKDIHYTKKDRYRLFTAVTKDHLIKFNTLKDLDENEFKSNMVSFLIIEKKHGMHVLIASKNAENKIEIKDPSNGKIMLFDSISRFASEMSEFLGVGLHVLPSGKYLS